MIMLGRIMPDAGLTYTVDSMILQDMQSKGLFWLVCWYVILVNIH